MIEIKRFNLLNAKELRLFNDLFTAYLFEVCKDDDLQEELDDLHNEKLNLQMIEQTLQKSNPYFIMQIISDNSCIGFISYFYNEDNHLGFINNFYISPTNRNKGLGSLVYKMTEAHLKELDAYTIELIPVNNAQSFYVLNGFTSSRTTADNETIYSKQIR